MRVVGAEKDAADDKSDDNRRGLQDKAAVQCCCWSTQRCRTYRAVLCSLSDHFAFRVRLVPPSAKVRDEEGSREGRKGRSGRDCILVLFPFRDSTVVLKPSGDARGDMHGIGEHRLAAGIFRVP